MEIIIHQADRRGAAGGEALGEFHGKSTAGRDTDRVMMRIGVRAVDAGEFTKFLHQLIRATHRARECATDADVEFSGSRLAEAGVEGHDFQDFDRLDAQLASHPVDRRSGDETVMVLDVMEQRQHGRAFLVVGKLREAFNSFRLQFGSDRKGREMFGAGRLFRGDVVVESGHAGVVI